jgi:hypothetical protein
MIANKQRQINEADMKDTVLNLKLPLIFQIGTFHFLI